ncbi:hypothetical protein [Sorangium sp. So ce233]|uniref:hypothetical protein n=1 Tax=Sorangium sp. So ce233 TaxID=3133290 RepID=UPI003F61125B
MSTSTARVIPFPSTQPAEAEADPAMEDIKLFLQAKRAERDAKATIERLKASVVATVKARGGVAVPGLGALTTVEKSAPTLVDMDEVEKLLAKHGEALPVKPGKGGGSELRATLLK